MTTKTPHQKAFASGVTLSIGLLHVEGKLIPIMAPKTKQQASLKMICPEHEIPTLVEQRYFCKGDDEQHGPFTPSTLGRAKKVDNKLVEVTAEELAEIKNSKETNDDDIKEMELMVHPADQVRLFPAGTGYRFLPTGGHKFHGVFVAMVANSEHVFMGSLVLKGKETLYHVSVVDNELFLQPVVFPSKVGPSLNLEQASLDSELVSTAQKLVEKRTVDYDPELYQDEVTERLLELAEAKKEGGVVVPKGKPTKHAVSDDVLEALRAELES